MRSIVTSSVARRAGLIVCALAYAAPAAAQENSVPREFVDVLWLNGYGGQREVLHIGTVPEPLRTIVSGSDARVIGAVERSSSITLALAARGGAASVEEAWEGHLEQAGWIRHTPQLEQRGGFVDSRSAAAETVFCSPTRESAVRLRAVDAPGEETYVLLNYGSALPRRYCGDAQPERERPPSHPYLPALPAPAGAIVTGGGTSSSGDEVQQSVNVRSELSPAELIAHYGTHMREQGWTEVEQAAGDNIALSVWRKMDAVPLFAWLSSTRVPGGDRAVQIEVRTVPRADF